MTYGRNTSDPILWVHVNGKGEFNAGRVVALVDGGYGLSARQQRILNKAEFWHVTDACGRIVAASEQPCAS